MRIRIRHKDLEIDVWGIPQAVAWTLPAVLVASGFILLGMP